MHPPPLQTPAAQPQPTDGGQAFPAVWSDDGKEFRCTDGMTLRDYFAGIALAGLINHEGMGRNDDLRLADARRSYAQADAMLAARKEGK
jgi:hypothetical protein